MNNRRLALVRGGSLVTLLFWVAFNNVSANPVQQMLQEINIANQSAEQHMKAGNVSMARLSLLSVMPGLQRLAPAASQSPVKEIFDAYTNVRNKAWPGAARQLTPQALQALLSFYEDNKSMLGRYGKDFNIKTTLPRGKNAYYRRIAQVLSERPNAWKLAGEWAMQAPPPDQLVINQQVYQKLHGKSIPQIFNNIAFGPMYALEHAQKRVIPENLDGARAAVSQARGSTSPKEIWRALADARSRVAIVETIDASVKELVDISALTAPAREIRQTIESETSRADKLFDKQVDSNRMPGDKSWTGKMARDDLIEQMTSAYKRTFPEDEIIKVQLRSANFTERAEAWWEKNVLYSAWAGYVKVAVAAKQPGGDYRVFIKRFRRTQNTDGSWTPLSFHSTIGSYLIRQENI